MYVYDSNWDGSDWATDGEWLRHGDSSVQLLVAAPAVNDAQAIIIALMEEYENVLNGDNLHRYFISTDSWIENSGNEDSADDENIDEQKWSIEIAYFGIKNRLPCETMHSIKMISWHYSEGSGLCMCSHTACPIFAFQFVPHQHARPTTLHIPILDAPFTKIIINSSTKFSI